MCKEKQREFTQRVYAWRIYDGIWICITNAPPPTIGRSQLYASRYVYANIYHAYITRSVGFVYLLVEYIDPMFEL